MGFIPLGWGECHKHAPLIESSANFGGFPPISDQDYCGDFEDSYLASTMTEGV
jgi:hypothetical protein